LEESMGAAPAQVVRICCMWYLVVWTASLAAECVGWLPMILRRRMNTDLETAILIPILVLFLALTSGGGSRVQSKLAQFSTSWV